MVEKFCIASKQSTAKMLPPGYQKHGLFSKDVPALLPLRVQRLGPVLVPKLAPVLGPKNGTGFGPKSGTSFGPKNGTASAPREESPVLAPKMKRYSNQNRSQFATEMGAGFGPTY